MLFKIICHQVTTVAGFEQVEHVHAKRIAQQFQLIVGIFQHRGLQFGEIKLFRFCAKQFRILLWYSLAAQVVMNFPQQLFFITSGKAQCANPDQYDCLIQIDAGTFDQIGKIPVGAIGISLCGNQLHEMAF